MEGRPERNVLLGVSGSIAAYKAAIVASHLTQAGCAVRTVLTAGATRFITAETFLALTGQAVSTSLWRTADSQPFDHLELASWADLLLIAPASANTVARLALGVANDLLTAVALAFEGPLVVAPAMESTMLSQPATQRNLESLRERGATILGPLEGRLASGQVGRGRMVEPDAIVQHILGSLTGSKDVPVNPDFAGRTVLVTAGPTREPLDPVRYLSNHSSGKMGYELARAAALRGATVILITGPVDSRMAATLAPPVQRVEVEKAEDMLEAVRRFLPQADVLIMAAAVADFRPVAVSTQKIKKSRASTSLELEPTEDILAATRSEGRAGLVRVGFAAETENLVAHAIEKLRNKGLDMVVANDVGRTDQPVFGSDENEVVLVLQSDVPIHLARSSKREVAERVLDHVLRIVKGRSEIENAK